MLAKYQYMLEVPASAMSGNKLDSMLELLQFSYGTRTENEDAEAFSAYSLETLPSKYKTDEVILYGIKPDSKYIDADLEDGDGVYISSAYAEKFLLKPGDSITLKEKYEKTKYTFKVKGIYKYSGGICVFMPQEQLNDTFDLGNDYFSGYFSNSKIKDIDGKYIGSVLDLEALTKISRQLDVSMGNMMGMVNAFAIGIYMVVIYLLSKIIIEKNAQAISMTKILGYTNGEISRLYIWPTTIVVIICLFLSLPIEKAVMNVLFREMMLTSISGWIALWIDPKIYVEMFLIGENGSGKSTLSSIISGVYPQSEGELTLDGKPYKPADTLDAQNHGISMIAQEMGTLPGIKVADNLFIGKEQLFTKHGVVDRKKMYQEARKALEKIGIDNIHPEDPIIKYSLEERKLIEVVRALYTNPRIFIVDETTTALSQRGRDIIYQVIKNMKKENKTVLFISHDLEELMEVCSKLIVLRDGVFVAELEKSEFEEEKIKELMVGRKLTGDYYRSDYDGSYGKEVVLSAEKLYVGDSLKGVSLELHKGEILGIGGLTDCGMHELGKALFGNVKSLYGEVKLGNGKKITSEKQAIKNKIGYVSKNRDQEALILSASIMENTVLPSLSMIAKGGVITKGAEKKFTDKQVKDMSIKCREIGQNVGDLSGGNKQKVVFGKWLGNESEIYILDCPTRGIDIGVKAFMYQLMYRLKKEGKSILMISEELPELIGMSDRILIMKDGQIQDSFTRSEELNESVLIKKMV